MNATDLEMSEHEANKYYQALVGEEFTGNFNGYFNRVGENSPTWTMIAITWTSDKMRLGLESIQGNFEGRIWKGFHNGNLYVQSENTASGKFKIVGYNSFQFDDATWKEAWKYTDKCGFHFILEWCPI